MSKAKLIATVGIPGSGKSTWAKAYIQQNNSIQVMRVNRDDLRAMAGITYWNKQFEAIIRKGRDTLVVEALKKGWTVIVDDTNLNMLDHLYSLATSNGAEFDTADFTGVPVETCIQRDSMRTGKAHVGSEVIYNMYDKMQREIIQTSKLDQFNKLNDM